MKRAAFNNKILSKLIVISVSLVFMTIFLEEVMINWIPFVLGLAVAIGIIIVLKKKEAPKIIGFMLATIAGTFVIALGLALFLPTLGIGMGFSVKDKLTEEQAGSPRETPINNGVISEAGNYIFYIEPESGIMPGDHLVGKLIRRDRDWTSRTELTTTMVSCIMVHDDLIYYSDALKGNYLYSMKFDGSESSLVLQKSINACEIEDDTIYYSVLDGMFKTKLGSTESIKLQSKGGYPVISGDWIYYSDSQGILYRVDKDGTEDQKLIDNAEKYYIGEDQIYYISLTEYNEGYGYQLKLFSCSLDGEGKKEIKTIEGVGSAMFGEGCLYCQLLKPDGRIEKGIFKVGLDGTDPERVNKAVIWSWDYILGDWAYALQYSGDRYRIKLDDNIAVRFE